MSTELAKRSSWDLVDRSAIESVCENTRRSIARAKTPETVQAKADEIETLLAAIRKWKPEFTPAVNAAWLFARKRVGDLTPKEAGGRPKLSDNNESLSQRDMDRRWENALEKQERQSKRELVTGEIGLDDRRFEIVGNERLGNAAEMPERVLQTLN